MDKKNSDIINQLKLFQMETQKNYLFGVGENVDS